MGNAMSASIFDSSAAFRTVWTLRGHLPGERSLSHVPVEPEPFIVGRQRPGVHLRLKSGFVSNQHAELSVVPGGLHVRDLESRNGTFVGGRRISAPTLVGHGETVAFADVEFRVERQCLPPEEPECEGHPTVVNFASFEADWTMSNFARLLQQGAIVPHFQPILSLADVELVGFEALARSEVEGLQSADRMFEAAEFLDQAVTLSRACRQSALDSAGLLPRGMRLFLNTHPSECLEGDVLSMLSAAREAAPEVRLVVEVHEELVGDPRELLAFSDALQELSVELALDDFGKGRSRLKELVQVRPTFVKFDREMIGNLDRAAADEREALRSLVDFLHNLCIFAVAEGIERREEAEACFDLGFDLAQGYYFARPMSARQLSSDGASDDRPPPPPPPRRPTRKETMDYHVLADVD
jgi:EAL domain-containing protein (putative c-di-GMP-specific phosphodiesterase class I)